MRSLGDKRTLHHVQVGLGQLHQVLQVDCAVLVDVRLLGLGPVGIALLGLVVVLSRRDVVEIQIAVLSYRSGLPSNHCRERFKVSSSP